jgi:hypothetical protein
MDLEGSSYHLTEALSRYVPEWTEENDENPQSVYSDISAEIRTRHIGVISVIHRSVAYVRRYYILGDINLNFLFYK